MKQTVFRWVAVFALILGFCGVVRHGSAYAETTDVADSATNQAVEMVADTVEESPVSTDEMNGDNSDHERGTEQPVVAENEAVTEEVQPEAVAEPTVSQDEKAAPQEETTVTKNEAVTQNETEPRTHTILHTNDIHGRMIEENDRVIGMAKLKTLKEQQQPDLMVDAGDAFQGLPVSNLSKGEEMAKAMNEVGYDAMAVGNHEFDFGYDQLKKLEGILNFPLLSANVYKDGKLAFKPSTVVNKNGLNYGIIGVTTPETATKTSPEGIVGVSFADPVEAVKREMTKLNGQVDAFVVLSHLGIDPSTQQKIRGDYLTKQLSAMKGFKHPMIVIDGHSHTVLEQGRIFGKDVLVQTGTALANVGKVTFDVTDGQLTNAKATLINVKDVADLMPNAALKKQLDKANAEYLEATSEVIIPNNKVHFKGERDDVRTKETNLGNAVADAMEAYGQHGFSTPSDFAVTNSGGIRASIAPGTVKLSDIITVLPFGNTIAQIKVTGENVLKAFEHSLSAPTQTVNGKTQFTANGGLLQISNGVRVYYDMNKAPGQRVNEVQVLNRKTGQYEPLDLTRIYNVATNDFTASGGDGFDMFGGPREEGVSLDKVMADYLKTADLSQYDTTEPQRMIMGQPVKGEDSVTVPPATEDPNHPTQTPQPTVPGKVIPFPTVPEQPAVTEDNGVVATAMSTTDMPDTSLQANTVHMPMTLQGHSVTMSGNDEDMLPETGGTPAGTTALAYLCIGAGVYAMRRKRVA
ncbi:MULTISPECIES: 5'-nucleotidase C-terminal domain-containing protein [unclassified Staphylococcus]|uniref:5'-nucleotidase C-terminal domain-containing protein n=1 Tax=unclassified Staphylococcus TaxID=91994 RepID=UPI0023EE8D67|nr:MULTISPECIES: 5'-nucleotidase C-terminal domain-containing protein [unclassified Staphylococcus]